MRKILSNILCYIGIHQWEYSYCEVDYEFVKKLEFVKYDLNLDGNLLPLLYHDVALTWPSIHDKSEMDILSGTGFLKTHMLINKPIFVHNRSCKCCYRKEIQKEGFQGYKWRKTDLDKSELRNKKIDEVLG